MTEATVTTQEFDKQSVVIERANPDDAEAIMHIKRDGWMQAYVNEEHGITTDDMERKFSDETFAAGVANWRKGIAEDVNSTQRATFVARVDGKVVGFTAPFIVEDGKRRIGAMYVEDTAQGLGVGGALLAKALEWHGRDDDVYLNVVSYNDPAIGFYEHFGFVKTGVETEELLDKQQGIKLLPDIEMVLKAKRD